MNSINTSSVIPPNDQHLSFQLQPRPPDPTALGSGTSLAGSEGHCTGRPGAKCDLYTVSEDGHFIGHDGFVVPRSFEEFFERHPGYVRGRVRLLWPNVSSSEREDRESELLIFLMTLPKKSKFRALGYNGPPKRLQGPRPDLQSGACPRCFRAPLLSLHKDDPDEPLYIVVGEGLVEPRPTIQHTQPLFIGSGWDAHR